MPLVEQLMPVYVVPPDFDHPAPQLMLGDPPVLQADTVLVCVEHEVGAVEVAVPHTRVPSALIPRINWLVGQLRVCTNAVTSSDPKQLLPVASQYALERISSAAAKIFATRFPVLVCVVTLTLIGASALLAGGLAGAEVHAALMKLYPVRNNTAATRINDERLVVIIM